MQLCSRQEVATFEREFSGFVGAKHCVGVGSGTDALQLILRALGIGSGDEVITVANTFIATVEAITYVGQRRSWSTVPPTHI
jgi:dTDP-4-amino-4,6-dideoxygalactose transaminase